MMLGINEQGIVRAAAWVDTHTEKKQYHREWSKVPGRSIVYCSEEWGNRWLTGDMKDKPFKFQPTQPLLIEQ